jgi:hypothetical protein
MHKNFPKDSERWQKKAKIVDWYKLEFQNADLILQENKSKI